MALFPLALTHSAIIGNGCVRQVLQCCVFKVVPRPWQATCVIFKFFCVLFPELFWFSEKQRVCLPRWFSVNWGQSALWALGRSTESLFFNKWSGFCSKWKGRAGSILFESLFTDIGRPWQKKGDNFFSALVLSKSFHESRMQNMPNMQNIQNMPNMHNMKHIQIM